METLPSDKTYVVVLVDDSRFFLTEEQATKVVAAIQAGSRFIQLGDSPKGFMPAAVRKIISGADYKESERVKLGERKCGNCGRWIPPKKKCGYCEV